MESKNMGRYDECITYNDDNTKMCVKRVQLTNRPGLNSHYNLKTCLSWLKDMPTKSVFVIKK